jgi:hypothetical protein
MTNGYNRGIGNVYADNDAQPVGVGLDTLHQAVRLWSQPIETKLDMLIGVYQRHEEKNYNSQQFKVTASAGLTLPNQLLDRTVDGFNAWSFIVSNLSGYILFEATTQQFIPPYQLNWVLRSTFATPHIQLWAIGGIDSTGHDIYINATEERLVPGTGDIDIGSGSSTGGPTPIGATNHVTSTITLASSAGALTARATRTGYTFQADIANAANIVISGGFPIAPGGQLSGSARDAFAFTGTTGDKLYVLEEYN